MTGHKPLPCKSNRRRLLIAAKTNGKDSSCFASMLDSLITIRIGVLFSFSFSSQVFSPKSPSIVDISRLTDATEQISQLQS